MHQNPKKERRKQLHHIVGNCLGTKKNPTPTHTKLPANRTNWSTRPARALPRKTRQNPLDRAHRVARGRIAAARAGIAAAARAALAAVQMRRVRRERV